MSVTAQLAKHFRDIHFGGNWTSSSLQQHLSSVTWQQATTQVHSFNTIVTLAYHTGYYVTVLKKVLEGGPLDAKDAYSFNHPPIQSQHDWGQLLNGLWVAAESTAQLIEQLPEHRLWHDFTDPKYGNYYRNIQGIIEHAHYHLGQIVLIKKILEQQNNPG
jgi:hypothetical protein